LTESGISHTVLGILVTVLETVMITRSRSLLMFGLRVVAIGLLGVAGCQQPADIALTPEITDDNLEVHAVVLPDADIAVSSVDSSAVLPDDQVRFDGSCVINSVTWDAGSVVLNAAYSRVFFADSVVRVLGRKVGVVGMDVGTLTLNSSLMIKVPHRIPVDRLFGRDTSVIRGVEYLMDLTQSYQADHAYSWTVYYHLAPVLTVGIETPEALSVLSPRGGSVLPRNKNAEILWSGGKGKVSIIVSKYDPLLKKATPLLDLRVKANNGRAVLPVKLLAMLPAQRYFVLTFILSNRKEISVSQPATGTIMVQAASVYNSYVELR
jgi:hypothetical protein